MRVYDHAFDGTRPHRNRNAPARHWRRKAERGYLAALSGKRGKRNEMAHAILALLDAQGDDGPWRLFRGWRHDRDDRSYKDRLRCSSGPDARL